MSTFPSQLAVLSLAAAADRSKLASGDAWLILIDVQFKGEHLRLARNVDPWTFDAGDGAGPQVYAPFNFDLEIELSSGGQLPSMALKASNVLGLLQQQIEQYSGVVGGKVSVYFVNTAAPGGEADLAFTTTILQTDVTVEQVSFKIGATAPQKQLFPRFLYRAEFCMWISNYRGKQCGYAGPLPTCDGSKSGPNGCKAHANEIRFGGFPGIGTNGAAIASQY